MALPLSRRTRARGRFGLSQKNGNRGDHKDAGHELIALHRWALRLCYGTHPQPAEAGDLVQETYFRAIRGAESLRAGSNVKSWLFTILRNIRLNQLRQQRTAPKFIELDADEGKTDIAIETSPDPYAHYVGKTERERVREAI